jgi:DNA-binding PadR family transcriptional regulator
MPRDALANPVVVPALGALLERPMHPYQLATVLRERGVPANRGSMYDTLGAMEQAGWVTPLAAEQDGARPQRTPFALTDTGRDELVVRLGQQIRTPRQEFPEFLGAVSHLGVLGRAGAADALRERAGRLTVRIAETRRQLMQAQAQAPRLFIIEAEYAVHMDVSERTWVLDLVHQIESGELAWPQGRPSA